MSLIPSPKYYLDRLGFDNIEEWASTFDCYVLGEKGFWFNEDGDLLNLEKELSETIREEFKMDNVDDWCYTNGVRFKNEYTYEVEDEHGHYWDDFGDCFLDIIFERLLDEKRYRLSDQYKEDYKRNLASLEALKESNNGW
jgi:hypothetical protein